MSTLAQFIPGAIKSIQRGTINFGTESSLTATISSVDTNKAYSINGGSTASVATAGMIKVRLTDATTVTASRVDTTNATASVDWQIIEVY